METPKDIYKAGRDRGFMFGQYAIQELQLGETYDCFSMFTRSTITIDDPEELEELRRNQAFECEANARQYSPFEFTAYELNHYGTEDWEPEVAWERFNDSIAKGIEIALYLDQRKQRKA